MTFAQRVSYWFYAGQDPVFFRTYRKEIHQYTIAFVSVFYKVMTTVFAAIILFTLILPDTPDMEHVRDLTPFGVVYTAYMALCLILFTAVIQNHIKASFWFSQITLLVFGGLLLWLDFSTPINLAVFIPVYFALFPMLLTVPVPTLLLDMILLYIPTVAGTFICKTPNIALEDIINTTICFAAGFFLGCKNIRSKLAEIKTMSTKDSYSALQKSIIDALIDEYESIAFADFDHDTINSVLIKDDFSTNTDILLSIDSLSGRIKEFAEIDVHPDDKKRYLSTIEKQSVIQHMDANDSLVINYRVITNGQPKYVQTKLIKDSSVEKGVHRYILCHRSIDAEVRMEQMMTDAIKLASQDSLTGVRNRMAYDHDLEQLQKKLSSGMQKDAGIVMVDVNWLKETNDQLGHSAGDELLKNVSDVVCGIYKHSPVYRIGGDEFAVILSFHDLRIRDKLIDMAKNTAAKTKFGVSFAIGMAVFDENDKSFDDTIKRADDAMYQNKKEIKDAAAVAKA